jgi:hypothetical protein
LVAAAATEAPILDSSRSSDAAALYANAKRL